MFERFLELFSEYRWLKYELGLKQNANDYLVNLLDEKNETIKAFNDALNEYSDAFDEDTLRIENRDKLINDQYETFVEQQETIDSLAVEVGELKAERGRLVEIQLHLRKELAACKGLSDREYNEATF